LALVASFARVTRVDLMPNEQLWNAIANAGQRLFGWPQPNGLPDENAYFLGANSMRQRWSLVLAVAENAWGTGDMPPPVPSLGSSPTPRAVAAHYLELSHGVVEPATLDAIIAGLGWPVDQPLGDATKPEVLKRMARIAALSAMAPSFQSV
jgi:hypothetical protein